MNCKYPVSRRALTAQILAFSASVGLPAWAQSTPRMAASVGARRSAPALTGVAAASPEARLIEIYRAIGAGDRRRAMALAEALTRDVPNFQLGQLVHGDLLQTGRGPLRDFGAAFPKASTAEAQRLHDLRDEARRRVAALKEMPPPGAIPRQVIELASNARHLVAVDASHSRVYVFEHRDGELKLLSSQYASVGRAGIDKQAEGDLRTPLGVYYVTSRLSDDQLDEMYGVGALPLNFPNEFDRRRGRSGGGIWLHGVPRASYSRSPYATEGCVAVANEDMSALMRLLEPRRTPVIIAEEIHWVKPEDQRPVREEFRAMLQRWGEARVNGDLEGTMSFYSDQFQNGATAIDQWRSIVSRELAQNRHRKLAFKDVSIMAWKRESEVTLVTFAEIRAGGLSGPVKRQYWGKEGGRWKVFFEGVVG